MSGVLGRWYEQAWRSILQLGPDPGYSPALTGQRAAVPLNSFMRVPVQNLFDPAPVIETDGVGLLNAEACRYAPAATTLLLADEGILPTLSGGAGPGREYQLVAKVQGGTGAGSYLAYLDVRRGTQITIPATAVTVSVGFVGANAVPLDSPPNVSAMIADGGGQYVPATLTGSPKVLEPAGDAVVQIPPFAVRCALYCEDITALELDILAGDVVADGIMATIPGATLQEAVRGGGVLLPGSARSVRIINAGVAILSVRPVFELGL